VGQQETTAFQIFCKQFSQEVEITTIFEEVKKILLVLFMPWKFRIRCIHRAVAILPFPVKDKDKRNDVEKEIKKYKADFELGKNGGGK
jgi:hypothetical protein